MSILVRVTLICLNVIYLIMGLDTVPCVGDNPLRCHQSKVWHQSTPYNTQTVFRRSKVFGAVNRRLRIPNSSGQAVARSQLPVATTRLVPPIITSSLPERLPSFTASPAPVSVVAGLKQSTTMVTFSSTKSTIVMSTTKRNEVVNSTAQPAVFPTLVTVTIKPTLSATSADDTSVTSKAFGPKLHDAVEKISKFNSDKLLVGPVGGGDNADPVYLRRDKVGLPPNTDVSLHRPPTGTPTHIPKDQGQPIPPPYGEVVAPGQGFGENKGDLRHNTKQSYEDGAEDQETPKPTTKSADEYSLIGTGDPGYGPQKHGTADSTGYGALGTNRMKPGNYGRAGFSESGYSGTTPFDQAELKKTEEKTESEELKETEEANAERNKVNPKLIGEMSRFSTHSIRTGPRGSNAKLISAKYYYPPKKDLPLPKCFYNGDGYVCCSLDLNELMVNVYKSLQSDPHFHTCNIGAVTSAVQRHAEEKFDTPFEAITGFEDYAQKIHFSGDLVCKIEIDGKFILAYATPYNAEEASEMDSEDPARLPTGQPNSAANKTGLVRRPRYRRHIQTNTILMGPKLLK